MKNTKGFTLIELLVVVLIIGILAAIALPQYFKAVEKSRGAEALSLFGSIAGAEQRYYLLKDHYTKSFEELDLDFTNKNGGSVTGASFETNNFTIYLVGADSTAGVTAKRVQGRYPYDICKNFETGQLTCNSTSQICASLGNFVTGTCATE